MVIYMFKKFVSSSLLIILCFSINIASGFDQRTSDFGHTIQKSNWNNLFKEGFEIDLKAAEYAQNRLKGGYYDNGLHAVVPRDILQTEKEWKQAKDRIARVIGPIPNLSSKNDLWQNSSKNIDHLLDDAKSIAPIFKQDFQNIANAVGGQLNFGPGNQYIVKSRQSLVSKVKQDASELQLSEEEAVARISDALRGTIIVDDLEKIPHVIVEILDYAYEHGTKVIFKNIWQEDRDSGYIGIHAKILLPLPQIDVLAEKRYVLAEMQIHLNSINDGTDQSPKERVHLLYEIQRSEGLSSSQQKAASKLLYLIAMQDVLISLDKKEKFASAANH